MSVVFRMWNFRSAGIDYGLVASVVVWIEDHWGEAGIEEMGNAAFGWFSRLLRIGIGFTRVGSGPILGK